MEDLSHMDPLKHLKSHTHPVRMASSSPDYPNTTHGTAGLPIDPPGTTPGRFDSPAVVSGQPGTLPVFAVPAVPTQATRLRLHVPWWTCGKEF